ncbi:PepSY-associated TM region [Loktanella fryxellensis]|uniref:PepSY-associated TM region n=1 Tax=Loktanella fryxellensis TaxID=245187 RepID=A0A1H8D5V6_9RHOB|nr:PepSY-associated TM region [Loktanella fryxellensis]
MAFTSPTGAPPVARAADGTQTLYRAAWRWHFYAGLYVIPFLIMLAVTGLLMLWISVLAGRDGEWIAVTPAATSLTISAQAEAAVAAVPDGTLMQYIAPRAPDLAAIFRVDAGGAAQMVAVDPYTGSVLAVMDRQAGWYDFASDIHGTLLLGVTGDRMIEVAASLTMVLLATGLYMWWPRDDQGLRVLIPILAARGRSLWKSLMPPSARGSPSCWYCSCCPACRGLASGASVWCRRGTPFRRKNGARRCPT